MTVVGLDDTDSRERGMCTTYVAAQIAERLACDPASDSSPSDPVSRVCLVRLNPAVPYKTRGNAALAIHADVDPDRAFAIARDRLESLAETADERTNPGLVVTGDEPETVPTDVSAFAKRAIREHLSIADATALIDSHDYRSWSAGNGRGRIGALAAIGSWQARSEWTYEYISYRDSSRWGDPRAIDHESVFDAAARGYPDVWDTVDRGEDETVCVPHTPGPILHGIRGDDPDAVQEVANRIEGEPVASSRLFVTNQGTDAHLRNGTIERASDGRAYRLDGRVASEPETRRGGHVFFTFESVPAGESRLECAAFEPTKRFRDRIRALRTGDRLTVCGEVADGTLKLEKFAVRDLVRTERTTPTCPACERTMKSAGRDQGYRCRDCGTSAEGKVERELDRDLEEEWYEVPPCARRHIAKPLVRGGFDAPTRCER
ncbi:tRNA(Ile)(2)-agmatinylcytidine synthase [Natronorubrum daqingense]|uniref:tRNA(Ile2) 2-agmatinylcytidine synthetase TiaS n=1 Tax=Natronorubrum daqingense TaxID=588898 RepID=A0A1N7BUZ2_9EURY|nr:tRNA(Ile)(2)-agmatinylcytidine synthase [Natronorubrum daqingense]APX96606.1 tRNA(Ile2) 2-agmatinylcytidine synthetase [Natronorubrum daqingense]SIR55076.1 tRNA(Ile2) 2-agmatinylcytidine synthetase [Natronorubrum daqingense]